MQVCAPCPRLAARTRRRSYGTVRLLQFAEKVFILKEKKEMAAEMDLTGMYIDDVSERASRFLWMPRSVTFQGPDMDTTEPGYASPSDLRWSWSSVPTGVDWIRIWAVAVDGDGNSLESISCTVDAADRQVSIPSSWWTRSGSTAYWIVNLSSIRATRSTLTNGQDAVMFGETTVYGALFAE